MKPRSHLLLASAFAWIAWAAMDGVQGTTQQAFAQPPGGRSRPDGGGSDRGRFGDRGRGDWRSGRPRDDEQRRTEEKRGEERSGAGSTATSSNTSNSSSRSASSSTPVPSSSGTTTTTSTGTTASIDLKKWATALVVKNDKNGDMILQREEQAALGSSAAGEDLNHDGMITIDEIVMHHSSGAATASPPASAGTVTTSSKNESGRSGYGRRDGGSGGDSRSKTDDAMAKRVLTGTAGGIGKDAEKRHSYRFSKATDKLPTGVPSWFTSRDTNKDGQVSMSEYGRSVSASMVSEFRRYDTNDDGIITPKEAAKQK